MSHGAATWITVAAALSASAVLHAADLPMPGIPQACGVQLKNNNFDRAHLEQVRKLGFRVVRKGVYWDWVEKAKGKYTFDEYDRLTSRSRSPSQRPTCWRARRSTSATQRRPCRSTPARPSPSN